MDFPVEQIPDADIAVLFHTLFAVAVTIVSMRSNLYLGIPNVMLTVLGMPQRFERGRLNSLAVIYRCRDWLCDILPCFERVCLSSPRDSHGVLR
jgi:hypothetical protein